MAQMMTAEVADGRIIDYKAIVVFSALSMVMFVGVPLFGYFSIIPGWIGRCSVCSM